jgi:RNA-binding protein
LEITVLKMTLHKFLRARAHGLKPVVITGQAGLSAAVLNEISLALDHHELIKVRVNAPDRETRQQMIEHICTALTAERIQTIGHIATLYRVSPDKQAKARSTSTV